MPAPLGRPRPGAWARGLGALAVLLVLVACERQTAPAPLGVDEEALVQAYVQLTVLQTLHESAPDSTAKILEILGARVDTLAVRRALDALSQDPMRWELVYERIASQLEDLEETPALWWKVARGESVSAPPAPRDTEPRPSGRIPAPDR